MNEKYEELVESLTLEELKDLSFRARCEATYLEMEQKLLESLSDGTDRYKKIATGITSQYRGIGKSCALARLSVKYDIPVVIANISCMKRYYVEDLPKFLPKYFKDKTLNVIMEDDLKEKEYDILLVDELFTDKQIEKNIKPAVKNCLVGYKYYEWDEVNNVKHN